MAVGRAQQQFSGAVDYDVLLCHPIKRRLLALERAIEPAHVADIGCWPRH
jgi:hypothetical protein